jgi:hypothetical protein
MRFCPRCGFPLGGVAELLTQGGVLRSAGGEELRQQSLSPRRKGVKQGVVMMLIGSVVVPVLGIINSYQDWDHALLEIMVAISAVIFFAGGLMRILYAMLFESTAPAAAARPDALADGSRVAPPALGFGSPVSALPPAERGAPVPNFTPRRMNTAELVRPPSVTENTTRLLDEEKVTRNE